MAISTMQRGFGPLDLVQIAGLTIIAAILSIALYGLYNIFLHPLSRWPGPKLWAAYRMPYALRVWQGVLPFKVLDFHKKYGPVVRVAPNELAFLDPAAWNDIQGLLPDRRQNKKDFHAYGPIEPGDEKGIIFADDENHARIRRTYAPAFTVKAVEEQEDMLQKYANLLVSSLTKATKTTAEQDMSAWYNYTTFDLTGEFAFDEPFHCLDQGGKDHFFLKTVFMGVVAGLRMAMLEHYGIWTMMRPLIPKAAFQAKTDMDDYTSALVDRRRSKGFVKGKTDVFNYLLQNKHLNGELTRDELIRNGVVLVVAGSETTATLLAGVTYYLCKSPAVYAKVKQEVRSKFGNDDEITVKAVNDLTYMRAVLSEALRIFPPTGFGFPREVISEGGQRIAGTFVPQGTLVAAFHYAVYHSDTNFARADEFIPERWLDDAPPEFDNDKRDGVQPFNVGPRNCLGKNLAYAEMRLLLAKMLFHFDFELADPNNDWVSGLKAFSIWQRHRLMVRLKPVKR